MVCSFNSFSISCITSIVVLVVCLGLLDTYKLPYSLLKLLVISKSSLVIKKSKIQKKVNLSQNKLFLEFTAGARWEMEGLGLESHGGY